MGLSSSSVRSGLIINFDASLPQLPVQLASLFSGWRTWLLYSLLLSGLGRLYFRRIFLFLSRILPIAPLSDGPPSHIGPSVRLLLSEGWEVAGSSILLGRSSDFVLFCRSHTEARCQCSHEKRSPRYHQDEYHAFDLVRHHRYRPSGQF